jgi:hypothetical protein
MRRDSIRNRWNYQEVMLLVGSYAIRLLKWRRWFLHTTGYGNPPPETVIVLGLTPSYAYSLFQTCSIAGTTTNPYGIQNEESQYHHDILLCRHLRQPWEQFWQNFRYFGRAARDRLFSDRWPHSLPSRSMEMQRGCPLYWAASCFYCLNVYFNENA